MNNERINYKLFCLTYMALTTTQPFNQYTCNLISLQPKLLVVLTLSLLSFLLALQLSPL